MTNEEFESIDWQDQASDTAEEAYVENFSSRRGIGTYADIDGVVFIYDNNPYGNSPLPKCKRRRAVLDATIATLSRQGVAVLAQSEFPIDGESWGYTVAIIFDVRGVDDGEQLVRDAWTAALVEEMEKKIELSDRFKFSAPGGKA